MHNLLALAYFGFDLLLLLIVCGIGRIAVAFHCLSARSHFALRGVCK